MINEPDPATYPGWSEVKVRNDISATDDEILKECEALLITVLGTCTAGAQNRMRFARGQEWTQVTTDDYAPAACAARSLARGSPTQASSPRGSSHTDPTARAAGWAAPPLGLLRVRACA